MSKGFCCVCQWKCQMLLITVMWTSLENEHVVITITLEQKRIMGILSTSHFTNVLGQFVNLLKPYHTFFVWSWRKQVCFSESPDVSRDEVKGNIRTQGKTKPTSFPRDHTLRALLYNLFRLSLKRSCSNNKKQRLQHVFIHNRQSCWMSKS